MTRLSLNILIITLSLPASAAPPETLLSFTSKYTSHYISATPNSPKNHYFANNQQAPNALVFLPGMGEPAIKYYELTQDLAHPQLKIYLWDHIGQGFATHLLPGERDKTHINSFDQHTQGLTLFLKDLRTTHKNITLLGHSMGGHIALKVAYQNPNFVDQLILTAPFIEFSPYLYVTHLLRPVLSVLPPTNYPPFLATFSKGKKGSFLADSKKRRDTYQQIKRDHPEIKRRAVTNGWLLSAINSLKNLSTKINKPLPIPILVLEAEKEYLVSRSAQKKYCQGKNNCRHILMTGSLHEILVEKDEIRQKAIDEITQFLFPILKKSKTPN